eukprot:gnl/MRDRNA2_/MRDRNA2_59683_c0_seq1.p1 gnl/MRDRNA2_/MRDRNA2_59683_c0~~gnl/MRDRNA2_/MRDRNA2_59683_c0_seq1.p1  ORF type:complete len:404 (-),score=75.29 gnl/MRDRNA2_/MRDRNA2_59683_c0_seq1:467-1513(-)
MGAQIYTDRTGEQPLKITVLEVQVLVLPANSMLAQSGMLDWENRRLRQSGFQMESERIQNVLVALCSKDSEASSARGRFMLLFVEHLEALSLEVPAYLSLTGSYVKKKDVAVNVKQVTDPPKLIRERPKVSAEEDAASGIDITMMCLICVPVAALIVFLVWKMQRQHHNSKSDEPEDPLPHELAVYMYNITHHDGTEDQRTAQGEALPKDDYTENQMKAQIEATQLEKGDSEKAPNTQLKVKIANTVSEDKHAQEHDAFSIGRSFSNLAIALEEYQTEEWQNPKQKRIDRQVASQLVQGSQSMPMKGNQPMPSKPVKGSQSMPSKLMKGSPSILQEAIDADQKQSRTH